MNDEFSSRKAGRDLFRRYADRETTMNKDDERDHDEERYNRELMNDTSEDPEGEDGFCTRHSEDVPCSKCTQDDGTRVIVFRVAIRIGRNVPDKTALTGVRQIMARAWQRNTAFTKLAGPVTIMPDASLPTHCAYCSAEVEEQDTGLWETGGHTASVRRYCTDAPDHLHAGEATTCDRCGGRLIAGEGDGRYCGPCTNTLADEPDHNWRQRAVEAEAALTVIGGIVASGADDRERLFQVDLLLRRAGQEADRLTPPARWHTGMEAHDGYAPHSHEVRPDHEGVRRDQQANKIASPAPLSGTDRDGIIMPGGWSVYYDGHLVFSTSTWESIAPGVESIMKDGPGEDPPVMAQDQWPDGSE